MKNLLLDEILDFLTSRLTPEAIITFRPSHTLQTRANELLEKNRQGILSADETVELDDFVRMDDWMSLLKIRARIKLV